MMTFIDTNVILEYVLQRERLSEVKEVITLLLNSGHTYDDNFCGICLYFNLPN